MRHSSFLLAIVAAGCWTPNPPDGAFACNLAGKACPDGYSCSAGSCWRNGHTPDMAVDGACSDGIKDGSESDVDCGGSCAKCDVAKACTNGGDCASTFCSATTSLCVATSCEDGVLSSGETDVDCGGTSCPACVVGKSCMSASDCASMSCDPGQRICVSLQCQDGIKNGNETDVDCGGGICAPCATNQKCIMSQDCLSTFCAVSSKICVGSRCQDETKNGSETDIDCGGGCSACAANRACSVAVDCVTGSCIGNFCALASGPPNWLAVASMTPRYSLGAATAGDGKTYAIGGLTSNNSPPIATVEAYAPNQWAAAASYPTAISSLCATTALDGTIYAIAGATMLGSGTVPTVNIFTPGSGWTAGPSLPAAITGLGCATGSDGKIYSVGGSTSGGAGGQSYVLTPGSNWTALPDLPIGETALSAALGSDDRVYALGGVHGNGSGGIVAATSVFAYSPSQNKWIAAADMKDARWSHASATGADGRTYVFGGISSTGATLGSCEAYSPPTNAWVPCAGLGTPRQYLVGARGADGRIYAIGGIASGTVGTVEAYGPAVAMSPTSGPAGAAVALSGSNFAPNANVAVRFGVPTGQLLGTGVTDASGALVAPITFKIPTSTPAAYRIFAIDDRSQYPVNAALTITP